MRSRRRSPQHKKNKQTLSRVRISPRLFSFGLKDHPRLASPEGGTLFPFVRRPGRFPQKKSPSREWEGLGIVLLLGSVVQCFTENGDEYRVQGGGKRYFNERADADKGDNKGEHIGDAK